MLADFGVMRHATSYRKGAGKKPSLRYPSLTQDGVNETRLVGQRFGEFLADQPNAPARVEIRDVCTQQSRHTADALAAAIGPRAIRRPGLRRLSPTEIPTYAPDADGLAATNLDAILGTHAAPFIVVGHDPQTSWFANAGLRRRSLAFTLQASELIWRARPELLGERWENDPHFRRNVDLEWVFSPRDSASTDQIRAKIESKMNSAKVLGTFLTGLFALVAREVLGDDEDTSTFFDVMSTIGLALLGLSIILFFITLYRYDSLLMPSRFWGGAARHSRRHVRRPPAPDVWVLAESMVRIWTWNFTSAVLAAGAGVLLLALAYAYPLDPVGWLVFAFAIAAIVLVASTLRRMSRPTLGSND